MSQQNKQEEIKIFAPGETYSLKKPIELGVGENKLIISELTFTDDPVAEHLMALDKADGQITATMHFLAAITDQPFEAVKKLSATDLIQVRPTVQKMLGEFGLLGS